jgi:diguanylate cyclase (GGDEF)-like protein
MLFIVFALVAPGGAATAQPITVTGSEAGAGLGENFVLWSDPTGQASQSDALEAFQAGEFSAPPPRGSTGLAPGAFWSRFELYNPGTEAVELRLEYIDHQLVSLQGFQRGSGEASFQQQVDLSLEKPFSTRPIPHHRFVIPVTVPAGDTAELFVRYGSHQMGFVFPELRIWSPAALAITQSNELALISLIVGGLLVMAFIATVSGLATGSRFFYVYALHALASIAVWFTVIGFTHQFLMTESFHWRYMSITGAFSLFTGLYFAREFLHTRQNMRRIDYLLIFQMANAVFLVVVALAQQTALSVISITLALLLYPTVSIAGLVRWYQGAREAGLFTIAWTFLVIGLFTQALRDLGFVEHNMVNYYWPALASYGEMAVILVAMGIRIRDLRGLKEAAEKAQMQQLQESKLVLEAQVAERTRELEAAKNAAEIEARTDTLTGVNNRRSFLAKGQKMLERCLREELPLNLVMLDIDHFKAINDQYGHEMGDRALQSFAESVMGFIRDRDLFGRLGGEEFALMFISEPEAAVMTAERLRDHVRTISLDTDTGSLRFTTSIGLAHCSGQKTVEELLRLADEAMYEAKDAGRDQVKVSSTA